MPRLRLAVLGIGAALLAAAAGEARAGEHAAWLRPVEGPVLRPFAVAGDRFAAGQHRGVDLGAPVGTAVRAACAGRVTFAGEVGASGRTVTVGCGRLAATYLHLATVEVPRGRRVAAGTPIGTVGRSGRPRVGRAHLHLGARDVATDRYVDPLALLGEHPAPPPPPPAPLPARPRAPALPRLGPAPAPAALPAARRAPSPVGARAGDPRGDPAGLPWPVHLGAALLAAGVGAGGLVARRQAAHALGARAQHEPQQGHR